MDIEHAHIGRRIREIRVWRGMSVTATASLAGMAQSYLSMIERGHRLVTKRSVLESIAAALRVPVSELDTLSDEDPVSRAASLAAVEAVLTEWWPGEIPDDYPARPWKQVEADLDRLVTDLRPRSDYGGQSEMLPGLLHDLLIYAGTDAHRSAALVGQICAYHTAGNVATRLGARHLGLIAADRMQASAEVLGDPAWLGVAGWSRAQWLSSASRSRQYRLAVVAADMPDARLESRGMGHLTAALAAAAQGDGATAEDHLAEASVVADELGLAHSSWGSMTMNFGRANVGTWRLAIGVELGKAGRAAEQAREVEWRALPMSRQAAYWADFGRALAQDRRTRDDAVRALLTAEQIAPQQVHTSPLAREAITGLMASARRDAVSADLRRLALRAGIAPTG
ncbi:helix-turn-helix domain-containing protein [Actinophytocola sediminis]